MAPHDHELTSPPVATESQLERACDRFEAQWRDDAYADLPAFLAEFGWSPAADDQTLAEELVCIDLEHRWRVDSDDGSTCRRQPGGLGACPTADDYTLFLYGPGGRATPWLWVHAEWNARVQSGEPIPTDLLRKRYSDRAEILHELDALTRDAPTRAAVRRKPDSRGFKLRCPQCHQATTIVVDSDLTDIVCESCGCAFNLVDQAKETRSATTLTRLGAFELVERLGFGGFGTVWKARDTRLERTVAVKVPRRGMLSLQETEMFLREARSAAQLRHPNIVSVHEVGIADGTPFLVTEFIRGVSLSDQLSLGARMTGREAAKLAQKLALAIHHAHEHGVIHRDVKPANVMIDDAGEPHVMDFGLAKRTVTDVTVTIEGQILGTPAYMSPEQARGDGDRADKRTDVYALGAVLFELLTGETPFRGTVQMLIKQVIDAEPPAPRSLNRSVPPDLETICLKCLEKDPGRRYPTALALASDLQLFLDDRPITARPIGPIGRRWRWCRRNPLPAALGGVVAALLVGIATVTSLAYLKTAESLRQQEISASNAEEVSRFLVDLFGTTDTISSAIAGDRGFFTADPNSASMTAHELLDRGAARIADRFANQPETKVKLLETMSQAYTSLGMYSRGAEQLELALETARGLRDRRLASRLTHWLGTLRVLNGEYDVAWRHLNDALNERTELFGEVSMEVASTLVSLGILHSSRQDDPSYAERRLREAIAIRTQLRGPTDPSVAHAFSALAAHQLSQNDESAKHSLVQMIGILKQSPSEDHEQFGDVIADYQLGLQAMDGGDCQLSATHLSKGLKAGKTLLGPRHPFIAFGLFEYGRALEECGRYDEAITAVADAIDIGTQTVGRLHPKIMAGRRVLAGLYARRNRHEEAVAMITAVLADIATTEGENTARYARVLAERAQALSMSGDNTTACREALRAIEIGKDLEGVDAGALRYDAADVLHKAGRPADAIRALGDLLAEDDPGRGSLRLLAELQLAAEDYAGVLRTTDFAKSLVARQGGDEPAGWIARYDTLRAQALAATGEVAEATRLLSRAAIVLEAMYDEDDSWVRQAQRAIEEIAKLQKNGLQKNGAAVQSESAPPSPPATVDAAR